MTTRLLATIVILSALACFGCGGGDSGADGVVDELYSEMLKQRRVMDSYEERLAITRGFLDEYPEGNHTAGAIDAVFYYMSVKLDDTTGAVEYAEALRAKIGNPEIAEAVDRVLLAIYAEAGFADRMKTLAARLAAADALDFDDHWNVIGGAVTAEDWPLVEEYCEKARVLATVEAVRAEYPGEDVTEAQLAEESAHREGMLLVKEGWAHANRGLVDDALADFARADGQIPRYYFDIPEYGLNVYWARALMMEGDFEVAIERLATDALVMRNDAALTALKEAYVGLHGSDEGYEAFAHDLHVGVATSIEDFSMPDYDGARHSFAELRGDVTLLTLWFPT